MNVLYLLNHAGKAGTESYVYSLIEKLNSKKISAFFAYNEYGLLVEKLKKLNIPTFQIKMRNPYDLIAVKKISNLCQELQIDVIHTHYLRENYLALLSKLLNPKVQVVYTSHFIMKNGFWLQISNRILSKLQSKVIAVCNPGKNMLISNGVSGKKIDVIFNGVDLKKFNGQFNSSVRKKYNINEDDFVFLCASRFAHDKGHDFLIKSIPILKEKTQSKFKLLLAGDGPLLQSIKELVNSLKLEDTVIFTGFTNNINELFYTSNVYINSSEHEALSFLIIEALASGLPLIATNMAGNIDIVNDSTKCGLLVEYNNPSSLANAMYKLMFDKDLRIELVKNGKKAVQDYFNLEKVISDTYNIYVSSCHIKTC